jgi:uncharacterized protein YbcC (UPF0753/DUF2309 family)
VASKRISYFPLRVYTVAACSGAAVALVDYLIGLWMIAHGLHAEATFLDEFLLPVFTSALVFVIELSHERDQKLMSQKSKVIELLNHHIRNALQTIVDSTYIHGNLEGIRPSVERIQWALQEVLPGQVLDHYEQLGKGNQSASSPPSQITLGC